MDVEKLRAMAEEQRTKDATAPPPRCGEESPEGLACVKAPHGSVGHLGSDGSVWDDDIYDRYDDRYDEEPQLTTYTLTLHHPTAGPLTNDVDVDPDDYPGKRPIDALWDHISHGLSRPFMPIPQPTGYVMARSDHITHIDIVEKEQP